MTKWVKILLMLIVMIFYIAACKKLPRDNPYDPLFLNKMKVTLNTPFNGSKICDNLYIFTWELIQRAMSYEIQISTDTSFSKLKYTEIVIDNSFWSTYIDSSGIYYWRVLARNNESSSSWSPKWTFIIDCPKENLVPLLLLPEDSIFYNQTTVNFSWSKSPNATSYRLNVSQYSTFNTLFFNKLITTNTKTIYDFSKGQYYWKVGAVNDTVTSWSETRMFIIDSLIAPVLNIPFNGSTYNEGNLPTFEWQGVEGATSYIFRITNIFGSPYDTMVNSSSLNYPSLKAGYYSWKVAAKNQNVISNFSEEWALNIHE